MANFHTATLFLIVLIVSSVAAHLRRPAPNGYFETSKMRWNSINSRNELLNAWI
jgi:hypothetical protein